MAEDNKEYIPLDSLNKEQQVEVVLASRNPLRRLKEVQNIVPYFLREEEVVGLMEGLKSSQKEEQDRARMELVWWCLPQLSGAIEEFHDLGISDQDLIIGEMGRMPNIISKWAEKKRSGHFRGYMYEKIRFNLTRIVTRHYGLRGSELPLIKAYFGSVKTLKKESGKEAEYSDLGLLARLIEEQPDFVAWWKCRPDHISNNPGPAGEWVAQQEEDYLSKKIRKIHDIHFYGPIAEIIPEDLDPAKVLDREEFLNSLQECLNSLGRREREILELRYGLVDGREWSREEAGKRLGLTRVKVNQVEARALRKLRHPLRSRKLKGYYK